MNNFSDPKNDNKFLIKFKIKYDIQNYLSSLFLMNYYSLI